MCLGFIAIDDRGYLNYIVSFSEPLIADSDHSNSHREYCGGICINNMEQLPPIADQRYRIGSIRTGGLIVICIGYRRMRHHIASEQKQLLLHYRNIADSDILLGLIASGKIKGPLNCFSLNHCNMRTYDRFIVMIKIFVLCFL